MPAGVPWNTSRIQQQGHLFQCADGCSPEDNDGVKVHCNEQRRKYVKPEGRLLRIVGLLPRCSGSVEYKKRPH